MATDKTHKIPNAPNLRFPGFEGGWKVDKIQNLFTINVGGDIDKKDVVSKNDNDHPFVVVANALSNNGVYGYTSTFKDDAPSITVTGRGDVGYAIYRDYPIYPIVRLLVLHSKGLLDCRFGQYAINNITIFNESTGVPQLTAPQLGTYRIAFPQIDEQKKISDFLALIDARIQTQIGAINKHESLIKAIAGELTCEGEKVRLADLVDCHSSTMQENDITNDGPYPVYGATGICGYTDSPMCKEDAIIIVKDGSGVGNIKFVSGGFSILGTLCYLTAKQDVSIGYVYCCLVNFDFSPYKTGMAIPHIYFKDYGKGIINMKSVAEQQRTRTLLFLLMDKLDVERKLLAQYKLQKQYLLSQMFV